MGGKLVLRRAAFNACPQRVRKIANLSCVRATSEQGQQGINPRQRSEVLPMSPIEEYFRLNGGDAFNHHLDRSRQRAGIRRRPGTVDVNAFLEAAGLKGRRR
jgi:hypothetical protein